jgi:predicted GNAT family acetyltransferase
MSSPNDDVEVLHLPAEHRFVIRHDEVEAELVYQLDGDTMVIVHTEVPEALGGRGAGGRLVNAAVNRAAAEGLTVVPWCPFARHYLRRHPDAAALVTVDWSAAPPTVPRGGDGVAGRVQHVDEHLAEHLDEQEEESFPASDPHSDWAGPG